MQILNKQSEQRVQATIALVALFCLLVYTYVHTGSLLAGYVRPWFVGYVAAFGIELAVAFISYRLATLKQIARTSKMLLMLLAFALLVSVFANVSEGYEVKFGQELSMNNIGQIDIIQAIIGVSATGLLSIMVFAVSEVIGSDANAIVRQAERSRKKSEQEEISIAEIPEQPEHNTASKRIVIYELLAKGEQQSPTIIAERAKCSKATASKWINEYVAEFGVNGRA